MRPRPLIAGLGLALAAGTGCVGGSCAPGTATLKVGAAQPRGAATTAGPFRLVIERIVQNSSLTLNFAGEHAEEGGQSVYLYLAAIAPDRGKASGITGLASGATAITDTGQTVRLSGYSRNEEEAPDGHSWKAYLLARDLELAARRLRE